MKPLELNLASRPFRNDTPIALLLGALAVVAIAFTAYNAQAFLTADAREAALREELTDHGARMTRLSAEAQSLDAELSSVDVGTLESQSAFVASVLQERNFSWTTLFNELERVIPWNVRLASIRPEFTPSSIKLSLLGTAKNDEAFFDFQDVLERAESFSNVLPSQWERKEEGSNEISFTLNAVYRPARPADRTDGGAEEASKGAVPAAAEVQRVVVDEPGNASPAISTKPAPKRGEGRARGARRGAASSPATTDAAGEEEAATAAEPAEMPRDARRTEGTGDAPAAAGGAASGDAAGQTAGSSAAAENAGSSLSGYARTRGEAPPSREVRTVERQNPNAPPSDPNNPRNPPEIIRDAQGNPVGVKPRVSPLAEDGPLQPTGDDAASDEGDSGAESEASGDAEPESGGGG